MDVYLENTGIFTKLAEKFNQQIKYQAKWIGQHAKQRVEMLRSLNQSRLIHYTKIGFSFWY